MHRSMTSSRCRVLSVLCLSALLSGMAACEAASVPPGTDVPVVADLPADPGDALPDVSPDVAPDVAPDAVPEIAPDACTPDCGDHPCGQCVPTCDWTTDKPTTCGPAGSLSSLQTPVEIAAVQSTCFDYTGDGLGDNGFKLVGGQINGPLAGAVNDGGIAFLFELVGGTNFTNAASFPLNGLLVDSTATPPATFGDFLVREASYLPDLCRPTFLFPGATITDGVLAAGPAEFQFSIPVGTDFVIDVTLIQVKVKGTLKNGGADGFELTDGVLSGVLTRQQIEAALARQYAFCDAAPADARPTYCDSVKTSMSPMPLLLDLHQVGDGTFVAKTKELPGDAASVCLTFTLSKARVVGFAP